MPLQSSSRGPALVPMNTTRATIDNPEASILMRWRGCAYRRASASSSALNQSSARYGVRRQRDGRNFSIRGFELLLDTVVAGIVVMTTSLRDRVSPISTLEDENRVTPRR